MARKVKGSAAGVRKRLKPDEAQMARYSDACIAKATSAFQEIMNLAGDAEARMVRFFEGIQDGMPPVEAAYYFLHLSKTEYEELEAENSALRFMVRSFQGHVAKAQYKKITGAANIAGGEKWLAANRPDVWHRKIDVTSGGEALKSGVVIVHIPDNERDSNDHSPATGATDAVLPDQS